MKRILALILALSMALALTACTGSGDTEQQPDGTAPAHTDAGDNAGRDDLVVILGADFTTLDPQKLPAVADINFCTNIFDGLVALNEDNEVVPMLATDWEPSEDGLSYTFHLREGVKFHNGNDFTADDVKLSVERFRDQSWMQFASFAVDSCEIVDDYTVTINLKYAYGNFINMLWYCSIIDSDYYNSVSEEEFARNPVGTGPYKFVEWTPAQHLILEANEDYWDGAPAMKKLTFNFISDVNTALIAMETGQADMVFGTALSATTFLQAQKDEELATDSTVGNSFYFINFNSDRISQEVRQALSYAIDREAINILVNEGTGYVGDIPLVEGQEGYTTDLTTYEYNVDKAKELLAAAGAEGLSFTFYYGESADNTKLGQALQSQLANVGVNVELQPVENGTWWATFGEGDYDISRGGYPMEAANTDSCYYDMFHSTGTFNVSRVHDAEIDALLDEARVELDSERRNEIYIQVNQMLTEEAYFIPLYFSASMLVYDPALQGAHAVSTQNYQYKDLSW